MKEAQFIDTFRQLNDDQKAEIEAYIMQLINGQTIHPARMTKDEYQKLTEDQKLERKRQSRRAWAQKHREEINAKRREAYAADPEKRAAAIQRATASRMNKADRSE